MKLESVQSLKAEILAGQADVATNALAATTLRAAGARRAVADRALERIALGVAVKDNDKDFQLAVRLQSRGPDVSAVEEEIRKRASGEVDVKFVGRIVKFASQSSAAYYRQKRRPLRIGSSISDVLESGFISAGTLGCFVVGRSAPHYLYILTNNHVIANENSNSAGEPVVQPGTLDGGAYPANHIGELGKYVKLKTTGANLVDAALAHLYEGFDYDPTTIGTLGKLNGLGNVMSLPARAKVHKVGRTTGQTTGRITAFDLDNVRVQYDVGVVRFDNQIEIEGTGNKAFCDGGDSGSLIVDENLRAIALLFAGGDVGGTNGKGLTYGNPIQTVLDALKVDLET